MTQSLSTITIQKLVTCNGSNPKACGTKQHFNPEDVRPERTLDNMVRGEGTSSGIARDSYRGPSAPAITVPTWKRRLFIDRPADLAALAQELLAARVIAIDAEFVQ